METRYGHLYVLMSVLDPGHVRYLGISVNPTARFAQHKSDARRGKNLPIYRWMRSVGIENIRMEIETFEPIRYDLLLELEKNALWAYRSLGDHRLLNITDGGEGVLGMRHSEETKQKMRERMTGENNHQYGVKNPETSARNHLLKTGTKGHWTGRARSDETKKKLSEANKGKAPAQKLNEETVRQLKADIKAGMWQSDAATKYGIARSTVNGIVKGRRWAWVE